MIQLVYISTAVKPFDEQELIELLHGARAKNTKLEITGMLLYKNQEFMQALEGPDKEVTALAERIAKDPRHREVRVILKTSARQREFPDWTMGFRNLDNPDIHEIEGYNTFLDSPLRSHKFTDNPALCRDFLLLFKTKPNRVAVHR
jgi:hypothetical protein